MPTFQITIVNEEFSAENEHHCASVEAARKYAVGSALEIGSEQVKSGKPFFGAHVTISEDGKDLLHLVVSAGASPLRLGQPAKT